MIRINLAPQQAKRSRSRGTRAGPTLKLPSFSGPGSRWRLFAVVVWLIAPASVGWAQVTGAREVHSLEESIRVARDDSARLAAIHLASATLRAREDTIRRKVDVINDIDHGRYVWAHITDELARALPEHVWLTELLFLGSDSPLSAPRFVINGRTGSAFGVSALMQQLAASPFLTDVTLVQTTRVNEGDIRVYAFAVEAQYRKPEMSMLDMRPVFSVDRED